MPGRRCITDKGKPGRIEVVQQPRGGRLAGNYQDRRAKPSENGQKRFDAIRAGKWKTAGGVHKQEAGLVFRIHVAKHSRFAGDMPGTHCVAEDEIECPHVWCDAAGEIDEEFFADGASQAGKRSGGENR
jgi:hypothetical protein